MVINVLTAAGTGVSEGHMLPPRGPQDLAADHQILGRLLQLRNTRVTSRYIIGGIFID